MKYLACTIALGAALCAGRVDAQTFTTLALFTGSGGTASGVEPYGSLTLSGSVLYGMTWGGGANGIGNVFSVGTDGTKYQNLVSFTGGGGTATGMYPYGSLTLVGSRLYGMTEYGGTSQNGNIFSVGTDGTDYQNVVTFTGRTGTATGFTPFGSLTLSGSTLYGMTGGGGVRGLGNVFSVGTDGANFQNLIYFTGGYTGPGVKRPGAGILGDLTLGGSTLYGMTVHGGINDGGTVFSVNTDATNYQNLVSFTGTGGTANGMDPFGSLTLAGSTLYGMTYGGGSNGDGNVFSVGTNGQNYQNLLSFTGGGGTANGLGPYGSLILSGTNLYGTTVYGGSSGDGNIFSVGIDGSGYQDLYDFSDGSDGGNPHGYLTLSGGTLFGMSFATVFALTLPAPTPEPGTLALVVVGAAALVSYRWRRMRRKGRMSKFKCRNKVEERSTNDPSSFRLRHSFDIRHSAFKLWER
jgi:uncharacterized repeat protein (TIGR03803 family)